MSKYHLDYHDPEADADIGISIDFFALRRGIEGKKKLNIDELYYAIDQCTGFIDALVFFMTQQVDEELAEELHVAVHRRFIRELIFAVTKELTANVEKLERRRLKLEAKAGGEND